MLGGKSWDEWIRSYSGSHQNRVNRICHTFGIPLIALSIPLFVVAIFKRGFWPVPTVMFVVGWILQFVGHAFEGKPPEFFHDWRYLFVGLRWWFAKLRGKAYRTPDLDAAGRGDDRVGSRTVAIGDVCQLRLCDKGYLHGGESRRTDAPLAPGRRGARAPRRQRDRDRPERRRKE